MSREVKTPEFSGLLAKIVPQFSLNYDSVGLLWKAMNLTDPSLQEPGEVNHWPIWEGSHRPRWDVQDPTQRTMGSVPVQAVFQDTSRYVVCGALGLEAGQGQSKVCSTAHA